MKREKGEYRGYKKEREKEKEADQGGRKKEIKEVYRRGREAYKRYTSEQIKIVESSSIYGLAHRNCNHLYNYVDRHTISFQLSFFFFFFS